MTQPIQEFASNTDTTTDATTPPGAIEHGSISVIDPDVEILRLAEFLRDAFPDEIERTNTQSPEPIVSIAIRLLGGLAANRPGESVRCRSEYCNRPLGHDGEHGFINYQP